MNGVNYQNQRRYKPKHSFRRSTLVAVLVLAIFLAVVHGCHATSINTCSIGATAAIAATIAAIAGHVDWGLLSD